VEDARALAQSIDQIRT